MRAKILDDSDHLIDEPMIVFLEKPKYGIIETQLRPIREAYSRAQSGLTDLYATFEILSYKQLLEMRKQLDASYTVQIRKMLDLASS